MKKKEWCRVISQEELAPDIYSMWLDEEEMAAAATPGQFLSLYCEDGARLLPRPVSLCEDCISCHGGRHRRIIRASRRR